MGVVGGGGGGGGNGGRLEGLKIWCWFLWIVDLCVRDGRYCVLTTSGKLETEERGGGGEKGDGLYITEHSNIILEEEKMCSFFP